MRIFKYSILLLVLAVGLFFYFKGFIKADLKIVSPLKETYEFTNVIDFEISVTNKIN